MVNISIRYILYLFIADGGLVCVGIICLITNHIIRLTTFSPVIKANQ